MAGARVFLEHTINRGLTLFRTNNQINVGQFVSFTNQRLTNK